MPRANPGGVQTIVRAPRLPDSVRRSGRPRAVVLLLALVALAHAACGTDESPSPAGAPPQTSEVASYSVFYEAFASAYCTTRGACCEGYGQTIAPADFCAGYARSRFGFTKPHEAFEPIFDREAATACLAAVRAEGCGDALPVASNVCGQVLRLPGIGQAAPGDSCDKDGQCAVPEGADLTYCSYGGPRTCRSFALGPLGAACDTDPVRDGVTRACAAGSCAAGKCAPLPAAGEPCLQGTCAAGLRCGLDVCEVPLALGARCVGSGAPDGECAGYASCIGAVCKATSAPGCKAK